MKILIIIMLLFNCFLHSKDSLPKNIPNDIKIVYYQSLGMAGRGFRLSLSFAESSYENLGIRNDQKIDFQIDKKELEKLYSLIYEKKIHRFDFESGMIHDYDGVSLKVEWDKKQIDISQSGRMLKKKYHEDWNEITNLFDKLIKKQIEEKTKNVQFEFSKSLFGNYVHVQIDANNFVLSKYIDPSNQESKSFDLKMINGKYNLMFLIYKDYQISKRNEIYKDYDLQRKSIWDGKHSEYLNSLKKEFYELEFDTSIQKEFVFIKDKTVEIKTKQK